MRDTGSHVKVEVGILALMIFITLAGVCRGQEAPYSLSELAALGKDAVRLDELKNLPESDQKQITNRLRSNYVYKKASLAQLMHAQVIGLGKALEALGEHTTREVYANWIEATDFDKLTVPKPFFLEMVRYVHTIGTDHKLAQQRLATHFERNYLASDDHAKALTLPEWAAIVHAVKLSSEQRKRCHQRLNAAYPNWHQPNETASLEQIIDSVTLAQRLRVPGPKERFLKAAEDHNPQWQMLDYWHLRLAGERMVHVNRNAAQKVSQAIYNKFRDSNTPPRSYDLVHFSRGVIPLSGHWTAETKQKWANLIQQRYLDAPDVFSDLVGDEAYRLYRLMTVLDSEPTGIVRRWVEQSKRLDRDTRPLTVSWCLRRLDDNATQAKQRLQEKIQNDYLTTPEGIHYFKDGSWATAAACLASTMTEAQRGYWAEQLSTTFLKDDATDITRTSLRLNALQALAPSTATTYLKHVMRDGDAQLAKLETVRLSVFVRAAATVDKAHRAAWIDRLLRRCLADCRSKKHLNARFLDDRTRLLRQVDAGAAIAWVDRVLSEPDLRRKVSSQNLTKFIQLASRGQAKAQRNLWAKALSAAFLKDDAADVSHLSDHLATLQALDAAVAEHHLKQLMRDGDARLTGLTTPQLGVFVLRAAAVDKAHRTEWSDRLLRRCLADCRGEKRLNARFLDSRTRLLRQVDAGAAMAWVDRVLNEPDLRKKVSSRNLASFIQLAGKGQTDDTTKRRWAVALHEIYHEQYAAAKHLSGKDVANQAHAIGLLDKTLRKQLLRQVLVDEDLLRKIDPTELEHLVRQAKHSQVLDGEDRNRICTTLLEDSRNSDKQTKAKHLLGHHTALRKLDEKLAARYVHGLVQDRNFRTSVLPYELAHFAYHTAGCHPDTYQAYADELSKLWIDELAQGAPPEDVVWQVHDFWLRLGQSDLDKAWAQALFTQMENYVSSGLGYPAENLWHISYLMHWHGLAGPGKGSTLYAECLAVHVVNEQWSISEKSAGHHAYLLGTERAREVAQAHLSGDQMHALSLTYVLAQAYKQSKKIHHWREYLQNKISSTEGDMCAFWLIAMAYADQITPTRESPMRQHRWLKRAMATAQSDEVRLAAISQLTNLIGKNGQYAHAASLLKSVSQQFQNVDSLTRIRQLITDYQQQAAARVQRNEKLAQAANRKSLETRLARLQKMLERAEARGKSNPETIRKYEKMVSDLKQQLDG